MSYCLLKLNYRKANIIKTKENHPLYIILKFNKCKNNTNSVLHNYIIVSTVFLSIVMRI